MEKPHHNTDTIFDQELPINEWDDTESVEIENEEHLNDIENFFREDFEKDCIEEENF